MRNLVRGYIDVRIDSDSSRYCSYADRYLRNCIQYLRCTKEMIFEHQKRPLKYFGQL